MSFVTPPVVWEPLPAPLAAIGDRMRLVLAAWDGTPYMQGQQCPGVGVDCVRFVTGFLAAMDRREGNLGDLKIPQDASMHNKKKALGAMRFFLSEWPDHENILDSGRVQPGDILVLGPPNGGPGHAIVVGPDKNTLWHTCAVGVAQQCWLFKKPMTKLFRAYRHTNREADRKSVV